MPINDIVSEMASRTAAEPIQREGAPEMNAPAGEPEPTTMNTRRMLPPYLHNQTLDSRSAFMLLGTVLGLVSLIRQVMG